MARLNYEVLSRDSVSWSRAFLIRAFEERLLKLFSEGKLFGTVHTCIGQEFTGVAVAHALTDGDKMVSNHRCHGHYLARSGDADGMMAEVMGRITGICGGRGGSQHICAHGVYSNGIQGGMTPVSAGMALAAKLNKTNNIVVTFIGDGTLGEGTLYETLNIISKWDLPMMIVLENNLYAQSTSQNLTLAGDICARAQAFGIDAYHGTTANPKELQDLMGKAIAKMRAESRPAFVRVDTSRLMAHSKGDDDRPKDELARYWAADPITRFTEQFPEEAAKIKAEAEAIINRSVELATPAPFAENGEDEVLDLSAPTWQRTAIEGKERVVTRIYQALKAQMEREGKAFILGEDIEGPYGGAFKVTKDLSLLHPGRVRNTPISEAAIVGIGNGLALSGMLPMCEIMFGDFMTLVTDQIINHAAKFRWMYNDQVTVPVIVRTPMGGRRGYGATHSQCLEKHYLGIPGTRVLALNTRFDPYRVYEKLFATIDRPTIVIENKIMYGEYVQHTQLAGYWTEHTDEDFPTTRIRSGSKADVTVVCYGGTLGEAEKAVDRLFDEHEIVAEILCPIQIYPLNYRPILDSVERTGRLVVVEEGQAFCGFGAEVVAAVYEAVATKGMSFDSGPLMVKRVGSKPHGLASSKQAELDTLPSSDGIISAVLEMVTYA
ncbi:MAG TPA: thiamine pyrophosphate-dependent enzyme [Acidobacteriaceae bacterium]|nr:thiamine pyrophosphate-dependent enzyme [Acidobacteriaceae bacterium]